MDYLVDTQVLIWMFGDSKKIKNPDLVTNLSNQLYVSVASFWEIAIKLSIGKLDLPLSLEELVEEALNSNFKILDIEIEPAIKVKSLPIHHKDPFDRLIIAQAKCLNLPVISSDPMFELYDIQVIW